MGSIKIGGIIDRYNEAFGVTAQKVAPRLIQLANKAGVNINLPGLDVFNDTATDFANVTFKNSLDPKKVYSFGINTSDNKALPFFKFQKDVASQGYLAPPPMVSFRRGKNAVITPVDRAGFEVIENFGLKSWQIRLQGILVDTDDHQYPQELLRKVREMFEASGTYAVEGQIWDDLEIQEVFFKDDFNISFVEGFVDTVKYSVSLISTSQAQFLVQGQ